MEPQLSSLVIAAFIGFLLTVRSVSGEPPNFWLEAPVPSPENSPVPAPVPESSPPVRLIVPPPESVPPPFRLPRRMSPPPRKPREIPPPSLPAAGGTMNDGKRVGLMFAGMAAALQVFVAAYIIYKRRQLF